MVLGEFPGNPHHSPKLKKIYKIAVYSHMGRCIWYNGEFPGYTDICICKARTRMMFSSFFLCKQIFFSSVVICNYKIHFGALKFFHSAHGNSTKTNYTHTVIHQTKHLCEISLVLYHGVVTQSSQLFCSTTAAHHGIPLMSWCPQGSICIKEEGKIVWQRTNWPTSHHQFSPVSIGCTPPTCRFCWKEWRLSWGCTGKCIVLFFLVLNSCTNYNCSCQIVEFKNLQGSAVWHLNPPRKKSNLYLGLQPNEVGCWWITETIHAMPFLWSYLQDCQCNKAACTCSWN